tara:strand:+ start:374 stop:1000 length:627 start_codon:yes stop_codon:yes gene_type:complete
LKLIETQQMTTRKIEWFVFELNILSSQKINWKEKKYIKYQRINNLLINIKSVFNLNKSSTHKLDNLNNKEIKKCLFIDYPELKDKLILTSKLSYNKENTRLKQGVFLIDNITPNININTNSKKSSALNVELNINLISDILKSEHKNDKYNLIKGILNNRINNDYLDRKIKIGKTTQVSIQKILKNLMNYFKLINVVDYKKETRFVKNN